MKFEYISARGDTLSLTGDKNYRLVNIDNQTSVDSNISSVVIGGTDGDTVNNIQAQPRTIILDLRIIADVEATKRAILNVIKLKQNGIIRWEQENKIVEITGVVESIDMPRWSNAVTMQVSLHCEQPFWVERWYENGASFNCRVSNRCRTSPHCAETGERMHYTY